MFPFDVVIILYASTKILQQLSSQLTHNNRCAVQYIVGAQTICCHTIPGSGATGCWSRMKTSEPHTHTRTRTHTHAHTTHTTYHTTTHHTPHTTHTQHTHTHTHTLSPLLLLVRWIIQRSLSSVKKSSLKCRLQTYYSYKRAQCKRHGNSYIRTNTSGSK